ncbi:MAG: hypothetical protein Kow0059_09950 [Candidatus Sumerlaeia bacterium]
MSKSPRSLLWFTPFASTFRLCRRMLRLCIPVTAVFFTVACTPRYDPTALAFVNDRFELTYPDGTALVFKDTTKFDYTATLDIARAARLNDLITTGGGATMVLNRLEWRAPQPIQAGFRNEFIDLAGRWAFKYTVSDKPTSLTLIAGEDFLPGMRALRPVFDVHWRVTRFERGSGWMRYLLPFGQGPVRARVSGEITDSEGRVVASFRLAAAEAGLNHNGLNYRVVSWKYCARLMTALIGKGVAEILTAAASPPPEWRESLPADPATAPALDPAYQPDLESPD